MRGQLRVDVDGHAPVVVSLDGGVKVERPMRVPVKAAYLASWGIFATMAAASALGVFVHGLYKEGAWAREGVRGGDLATLVVAVPLLAVALIAVARGSRRGEALWMGLLAYAIYNYAFSVFGAHFNQVFLLHIAIFSTSIYALASALPNLDAAAVAERLRADRVARWIGGYLVVVGFLQGALWVFVLVRYMVNGTLIAQIPVSGQHLVFALDLGVTMPAIVLGGVLLWRRRAFGYVLGAAMCVMGAMEQLNLGIASVFQAHAHVAGITAFPPESILLTSTFVIAAAALLFANRTRARSRRS